MLKRPYYPIGMSMWPRGAHDHDGAYVQGKKIPVKLNWSETAWRLLRTGVHNIPVVLITPVGTSLWPWEKMTMTVHIRSYIELGFVWLGPVDVESLRLRGSKSTDYTYGYANVARRVNDHDIYRSRLVQ